jgi:hypothetical protein
MLIVLACNEQIHVDHYPCRVVKLNVPWAFVQKTVTYLNTLWVFHRCTHMVKKIVGDQSLAPFYTVSIGK